MDNQNKHTDLKMILEFFGNQFNETMNRFQENNDNAHDRLFDDVRDIKTDVHDIGSDVKLVISNQERQAKRLDDMEGIVGNLSDRITELEDEAEKNKHFWAKLKGNATTFGIFAGAGVAIWKALEYLFKLF